VIELFAYGTLRDPEYQRALFDRALAMRPATLAGWMPVDAGGGYLTIVRAPGERVAGDLLALDAAALATADAWEEVPLYERIRTEVLVTGGAAAPCWVYVRPTDSRERVPEGTLARHPRAAVLAQIRAFRLTRE
jgi:gamma-glutamylcyclotransferase (GGCT)/AIG2-like uncharacterized protein YtfP